MFHRHHISLLGWTLFRSLQIISLYASLGLEWFPLTCCPQGWLSAAWLGKVLTYMISQMDRGSCRYTELWCLSERSAGLTPEPAQSFMASNSCILTPMLFHLLRLIQLPHSTLLVNSPCQNFSPWLSASFMIFGWVDLVLNFLLYDMKKRSTTFLEPLLQLNFFDYAFKFIPLETDIFVSVLVLKIVVLVWMCLVYQLPKQYAWRQLLPACKAFSICFAGGKFMAFSSASELSWF